MTTSRSYSGLRALPRFEDRFEYLVLGGVVGQETFGSERHLNQRFYVSSEWRHIRNVVNVRDNGCDLGVPDHTIHGSAFIHHINPLTPEDFKYSTSNLLDPENLITVSFDTHNAIHYGDASLLRQDPVERTPGDTKLW